MATTPVNTQLDMQNQSRIINLGQATADSQPPTLGQVKALIEKINWKDDVRVAAPGNVNLSSPGATIDGVTMANGDRFLAPNQTNATEKGIYIYNGSATPATRAPDADTFDELEAARVIATEGTSAGVQFNQTAVNGVLGTNATVWAANSTAVAAASETTAGIAEVATQAETDGGTDDQRMITALKLMNWSGKAKKAQATIGDGSATLFTLTHNFNTRDVLIDVIETSGNYRSVVCEIRRTGVNSVDVLFDSAPALNSLRVIAIG